MAPVAMETAALHPAAPVLLTCLLIQLNPDGPKRAGKQRLETSAVRPALFSGASDRPVTHQRPVPRDHRVTHPEVGKTKVSAVLSSDRRALRGGQHCMDFYSSDAPASWSPEAMAEAIHPASS